MCRRIKIYFGGIYYWKYIIKIISDYYWLYFKILRGKRDVILYYFYLLFVGNWDKKKWLDLVRIKNLVGVIIVRFSFRFVIVFMFVCWLFY